MTTELLETIKKDIQRCEEAQSSKKGSYKLYQVASATASPKYVKPLLFSKKNSSFCVYVVLLSYHTKQLHIHKNCYA